MALLGACAADAAAGAASTVVTATTNEKLGTSAPFGIIPSPRLPHLVVEADAPPIPVAAFRALGVETHRAAPP